MGSTVADVGAGEGWFTRKLAQRVGAKGTVFVVDVQPAMVEEIRHWSVEEHLRQVIPVLGAEDDPHLPDGQVDAVLVVNAYHEMKAYDAMLHSFYQALTLGCRLVIIEPEAKPGRPRVEYQKEHVIPAELVKDDAARNGFLFVAQHPDVVTPDQHHWPFLVFEKLRPKPSTSVAVAVGSPQPVRRKLRRVIPLEILIQLVRSGATRTGLTVRRALQ